jgi:hypothetical protein
MEIERRNTQPAFEVPRWRDRIWRWLGLVAGGIVALIIAMTLLQCSLKKPESPTWDSTVRVPITSDHLDIANILLRLDNGDQFVDDQGNIGLFLVDTLDTVSLGANLAVPALFASVPEPLGKIKVVAPPGESVRANLSDFYAGGSGPTPPLDVFDIDTLGPFTQFTWIVASGGEAWLKVENQLGLDFDSVTVWVDDLVLGPLGTFDFPGGIAAGQKDSLPLGISGRRLYNTFQYQLYAHAPAATLLSTSNRYLDVSFDFSDTLTVDSGLLEVPQVVKSRSEIVGFAGTSDVIAIRSADLASGTLELTVENRTNLVAGVTVAVPSFTLNGTPLSRNLALQAWDTAYALIDLAGYTWVPEEPNAPQYFVVNAVAATVPSAPNHVLILPSDSVAVTARLNNVAGQSMTGVLAPKQITLPTFQQTLDIPSELNAFHPAEATLQVDIVNGSGAAAQLDFQLSANNGGNLFVSGFATQGSVGLPVWSTITEPNLAAFLDPFPTLIQVDGIATFGDSVSEYTMGTNDFAYAIVSVSAPLAVRIDTVTIGGNAERLDVAGSDIGEFTDNLQSGLLHADVGNHLPVAADLTFFVALDSALVYTAPDLQLGPITLTAGATDISGIVRDTTRTVSDLNLTHDNLQLFDAGALYVGYRVFLHDSGGQIVRFTAADYLDITAHFFVTMRNGKDAW